MNSSDRRSFYGLAMDGVADVTFPGRRSQIGRER